MAGYSGTPLTKKLGIKEGFRVGLVNPPKGFRRELVDLPGKVKIATERLAKPLDLVLLFVESEQALRREFPRLMQKLAMDGMLWVAWPKKSSGLPTDLAFDNV